MSLPSSMADFVPCDHKLQKAYCQDKCKDYFSISTLNPCHCLKSCSYQIRVRVVTCSPGPVVQKPINANPRLKINQEVYFSTPKCCLTLIFG